MPDDELQESAGLYHFQSMLLEVQVTDAGLIATMPDVPAGYEIRLEPRGDNQFHAHGGPADGAEVSFVSNNAGETTAMRVGPIVIPRVESADDLPVMRRVVAPDWESSADQRSAFDALLATVDEDRGTWLDYDLPYPKHEFLRHATAQNRYIFHGSNNQTIDELAPIRKSVEIGDESGRGNVQGVYGTHEALWAMFFATMHRKQLRGTIRNGVAYFQNAQGDTLPMFEFSINQEQLEERPYSDGAMYFLPRDVFQRLPMWEGVMSNEWACEVAVRPLAKLRVTPQDFPFLDQIQGHDDSEILRLDDLAKQLRAAATAAQFEGDRFVVWLPDSADVDLFIALQATFMPAVTYTVEQTSDGKKLIASNLPPAYQQTLRDSYEGLLSES